MIGLTILGIMFAMAQGDVNPCRPPLGSQVYLSVKPDGIETLASNQVKVSGSIMWSCPVAADPEMGGPNYISQYSFVPLRSLPTNGTIDLGAVIGN